MDTPNHRPLNKKQLDILRLLYRFRFGTTALFTQALQTKSKIKMNERLKILLDQQYIGRHFEPEYHLLRKHASYYLLPDGIDALRQIPDNKFDKSILRNIRKDKTASAQFIDHCLGIFNLYCQFQKTHGDKVHFFTKSQLVNKYEYFSEFAPNAYIRLDTGESEQDFLLEYLQSTKPFFTIMQRLKEYAEYGSSGEWEAETNSDFPKVLLVCDKPILQKRLMKKAATIIDDADDELKFYVASPKDSEAEDMSWHNLTEPDRVFSLSSI